MKQLINVLKYNIHIGYMLPSGEWCNVCLGVTKNVMTSNKVMNMTRISFLISGV